MVLNTLMRSRPVEHDFGVDLWFAQLHMALEIGKTAKQYRDNTMESES